MAHKEFNQEEFDRVAEELGFGKIVLLDKAPDMSDWDPETRERVERVGKAWQKIADEEDVSVQVLILRACSYAAKENAENRERRLGFKPPTDWKPSWNDGKLFLPNESIRLKHPN